MSLVTRTRIASTLLLAISTLTVSSARSEAGHVSVTRSVTGIAFASNRDDPYWQNSKRFPFGFEIYVMNPDGSAQRRLTRVPAAKDSSPAWSPDRRMIAFVRFRASSNDKYDIFVMNANGSGVHDLTPAPGWDVNPSWSPDGRRLAYESQGGRDTGETDIYVMNADGSGKRRLTRNGFGSQPSWSPDGRLIAFAGYRPNRSLEIYVMRADGTGIRPLRPHHLEGTNPAWSPDGNRIAFEGEGISVVRADGTNKRRLTTNLLDMNPAWSPDGRSIAFDREPSLGDWSDVYVMTADGRRKQRLTRSRARDTQPTW